MDVIGVRGMKSPKEVKRNRKEKKSAVKVVYISSPMKVKVSASEFRALVQELTGVHSDTDRAFFNSSSVGSFRRSTNPTVGDHRKRQEEIDGEDRIDHGFDDQSSVFGFFDFSMDQFGNGGSLFSSLS